MHAAACVRFDQELGGWAAQIRSCHARIAGVLPRLCGLAQGGTAVGTGINAHPEFGARVAAALSRLRGDPDLAPTELADPLCQVLERRAMAAMGRGPLQQRFGEGEAVAEARAKAKPYADKAMEKAKEVGDQAKQAAERAGEAAKPYVDKTKEAAQKAYEEAVRIGKELMDKARSDPPKKE